MRKQLTLALSSILCSCMIFSNLNATIGYWQVGYGTRSVGMGGVATAYPQDTIVIATNPAGISWLGNRGTVGVKFFSPFRKYSYDSENFGSDKVDSHSNIFLVPHAGYNRCICNGLSAGVAVYGNGGMNTSYHRNNGVFGPHDKRLGIDYSQAIIAPTLSYKIRPCHSIGISVLFSAQRLILEGLQNFTNFSENPNNVTNRRNNWDYGIGARAGWLGKVTNQVWLGFAACTPIWMTKNSKYKGVLAGGHLDIPANLSAGIRWEVTKCINLAFDYQRIFYNSVRAIGNSVDKFFEGNLLGNKNGPGFGWENISAYKIGVDYKIGCYTIRAGYAINEKPYSKEQIDFNILTPGITTQHITFGVSWKCWDIAYFFAPNDSRKGISKFGLGEMKHSMYQHCVDVSYSW